LIAEEEVNDDPNLFAGGEPPLQVFRVSLSQVRRTKEGWPPRPATGTRFNEERVEDARCCWNQIPRMARFDQCTATRHPLEVRQCIGHTGAQRDQVLQWTNHSIQKNAQR